MLATMLASIIIITAFALLGGVGRANSIARQTSEEMIDLQRVHASFEKAFRLIVTAEAGRADLPANIPPDRSGSGSGSTNPGGANSPATPRSPTGPSAPIIPTSDNPIEAGREINTAGITVRGADSLTPGSAAAAAANGTSNNNDTAGQSAGTADKPRQQKSQPRVLLEPSSFTGTTLLEMVLSEPPVALPYGSDPGLAFAMTRGGFVLKPPPPVLLADGSPAPVREEPTNIVKGASGDTGLDSPSLDLCWETYAFGSVAGPDRNIIASVRLAGGVQAVNYQFYKTDATSGKLEATSISKVTVANDLPAYVQVEITLKSGKFVRWLFEIGWTTGPEPDVELNSRLAGGDAGGTTERNGNSSSSGTRSGSTDSHGDGSDGSKPRGLNNDRSTIKGRD